VDGYLGAVGNISLSGTFSTATVLPAPLGVTAKQDAVGRVQVTWQPVTGAANYDVTISSGSFVLASGRVTATTAKTVGTLPRNLSMTANVRANTADDQPGLWSGEKPVTK